MIKKLEKSFAVSPKGAKDLIKGCVACALFNISLMLPVGLLYTVVKDLMLGAINSSRYPFYIGGGVLALVLIMLTAIMQYNTTYFATYAESGVRRIGLAEQIRKLPLAFFGKRDIADLTSTIMADCTYLEQAFSHYIPELFGAMISVSLMTASLFIFDWRMALAALWVVPVSFGIVILAVKIQDYLNTKQIAVRMVCADGIQECLESMRDLKSNNAEASYLKGLTKKIKDVETGALITELGVAIVVVSAQMILKLGIATVTLVGGMLLVEGSIDIFTFFFFLLVASRLYDPLQGALINLAASIETRVHISRMNEILYYPTQQGEERLTQEGCTIVFDRVGFSYESGEEVLNDVSFTAEQGQVTALVGPSGGGKTTVSRLAARFWDSTRGNITVGGMPISRVSPETLLSLYAIVFQDVLLFNNTIMENIRIGKKDATDEEVLEAARLANCDVFANKLPRGYHTLIGENGGELSGGERQRISIARAFLKNAPIILLDEATASLDVENEILIQTALTRLIQNKTVLVIAHRMRTIAGADKIVVLKDGKVAEQGSPKKLWEQEGIYRHMSDRQLQSQQWMFKEIDIKKTCF